MPKHDCLWVTPCWSRLDGGYLRWSFFEDNAQEFCESCASRYRCPIPEDQRKPVKLAPEEVTDA